MPTGSTYTITAHTVFAAKGNGNIGINNSIPTDLLDINGDNIRIRTGKTPTPTSTCDVGEISWGTVSGTSYVYVCVATNDWRRATLSTF